MAERRDPMLDWDGQTLELKIERDPAALEREPDKTFSVEAVGELGAAMHNWVLTRLYRHFARGRGAATRLTATLTVRLDGDDASVLEVPMRMTMVDGQLRLEATRDNL